MVWVMPDTTGPKPGGRRPWVPVINGPAMRLARRRMGYTMRDLEEKCAAIGTKLDRGNIGRAERGEPGAIGVRKLPAVAQVLNVKVDELLTEHGKSVTSLGRAS